MEALADNNEEEMVTKDDYYKDNLNASYSSTKLYSRCETLYEQTYVSKTYEEPDHDYFTYGKLVDAMVSEPEGFVAEHFVRVERKVQPEMALKIENDIKGIEAEIAEKQTQMKEKKEAKKEVIKEKIGTAMMAIKKKVEKKPDVDVTKDQDKVAKLTESLEEVSEDQVLAKGIVSRTESIAELQLKLDNIKELADKIQVTNAMWEDAEETANALRAHPSFSNLTFNSVTSQQIFRSQRNGVPRKGKLDHLKLSPSLTKFYAFYAAEQMTLEELQERIRTNVHKEDLWAIITDVKTCRSIEKLEPYNTHYRGQLGYYQDLVSDTLLIPVENIKCRILAADKLSNTYKTAELFEYTQECLDELKPDVEAWVQLWWQSQQTGVYTSAKAKLGWHQECFTCSECRNAPFSVHPGQPVMVSEPRFNKSIN